MPFSIRPFRCLPVQLQYWSIPRLSHNLESLLYHSIYFPRTFPRGISWKTQYSILSLGSVRASGMCGNTRDDYITLRLRSQANGRKRTGVLHLLALK